MGFRLRLLQGALVIAAALGATASRADSYTYCDFSNVSTLTLNGNAAQVGTVLRLTRNVTNQDSSTFHTAPVIWTAATSFHTYVRFQISPNVAGADGVTFILQGNAPTALGANGGGIGYGGIGKSVEVEFDTYQNGWDPNANHVGIMVNGLNQTHVATGTPAFNMANGGELHAWIDYDAPTTRMSVYLGQTAVKPAIALVTTVAVNVFANVGASVYAGFTGSTGGATNLQELHEWEFSTNGVPCTCEGAAGCPASTPLCLPSGLCGGCVSNAQCSAPTPYCAPTGDPDANQCVACVNNAECDGNLNTPTPICNKTGAPTDVCRACATNADCTSPLLPICEKASPHNGQCVGCATNADCTGNPAGPVCADVGATNACVQCLSDANCSGKTPVCNVATHQCRPCASDTDCKIPTPACEKSGALQGACTQCSATNMTECTGVTPVCDPPTGTCVGCETNANCAGGAPICNLGTHVCRPCVNNTDCTTFPGKVCDPSGGRQGQCVACVVNADCSGATPNCDTSTNTCVQCTTNAECSGGTPICSQTTHTCGPCTSDAECSPPTPACEMSGPLAGRCGQCSATNMTQCTGATPICDVPSSTCVACETDANCSGGTPICRPATHTCGPCMSDGDCTVPTPACQSSGPTAGQCGQCSPTNGTECMGGTPTPTCVPVTGQCGCNGNADCLPSQMCDKSQPPAGRCVPLADAGSGEAGINDGGAGDGGGTDASSGDGSTGNDGGGPGNDGGLGPDGSSGMDGSLGMDARDGGAGPGVDGGVSNQDTGDIAGGGCSCRAAGTSRSETGATGLTLGGLMLGLAAWTRRRKRCSGDAL